MLLEAAPKRQQDVDDDDDGADGCAHLMGHILVTVAHRLQLGFVLRVFLLKLEVGDLVFDITHEDCRYGLLEVLHVASFNVHVEGFGAW